MAKSASRSPDEQWTSIRERLLQSVGWIKGFYLAEDAIQEVLAEYTLEVGGADKVCLKQLRGLVLRKLFSMRRSEHREHQRWHQRESPRSTESNPLEGLVSRELSEQLHDQIKSLNERERQVIQLMFFEGLTINQIATRLGVSYGTVYNDIKKAVVQLRDGLLKRESQS
jgi:RNA polymerase sigma-70 factor (ECF subfamily)